MSIIDRRVDRLAELDKTIPTAPFVEALRMNDEKYSLLQDLQRTWADVCRLSHGWTFSPPTANRAT